MEEDDLPRRRKKPARDEDEDTSPDDFEVPTRGRRRREEDEDEEEPRPRRRAARDDDENEDEEERPRKRRKSKKKKRRDPTLLYICVGAGGLLLLFVLGFLLLKPKDRTGPFKEQMKDFLTAAAQPGPGGASLSGKFVVVSSEAKGLDDVYFDLPKDLQAQTPEEATIVVRVSRDKTQVGTYTNGAPGYRHTCSVVVIDWKSRKIVATTNVMGGMPPEKTTSASKSGVYGDKPDKDVVAYLKGLQRS
jgi:hypothetical protein